MAWYFDESMGLWTDGERLQVEPPDEVRAQQAQEHQARIDAFAAAHPDASWLFPQLGSFYKTPEQARFGAQNGQATLDGRALWRNPYDPQIDRDFWSTTQYPDWSPVSEIDWSLFDRSRGTRIADLGFGVGAGAMLAGAGGAGLESLTGLGAGAGAGATAAEGAVNWGGLEIPVSAGQQAAIGTEALPGLGAAAGAAPLISNFSPTSAPTNPTTGAPLATSGAGGLAPAAASTALGRIIRGEGTLEDYLAIGGTAGAVGLGIAGANQQGDALRDVAAQARADRAPFLGKSTEWLNNPQAYAEGPGKTFMDATLRGLSASYGNPIDQPTALGLATQAGLMDWRNAVTGFANLGLAGEDSRNNLLAGAAKADSGIYDALGYGLGQVTNPPSSLEQLLKAIKGTGASLV